MDLPRRVLAYALTLAIFLLVPPTLKETVGPPAGFTLQEAADLLTPLAVIPLAWWVLDGIAPLRAPTIAAALVLSLVWVDAHGIHLAANAIGDVFAAGPARDAFYATPAGDLDHFLDEGLGHWEWHVGWAGWSVLLLTASLRGPAGSRAANWLVPAVAGAIHGVTFFFVTTEGGTIVLGAAVSIALAAVGGRPSDVAPRGRSPDSSSSRRSSRSRSTSDGRWRMAAG